ncbi:MAG: SoxR reducing system RseC family protein [Clostridiales bacterium]|nr:SoxR reducing system RseC family protein [Clostridiales bacterium]
MIRTGRVVQTDGDILKVCFSRLDACGSCGMCGGGRDDAMVSIRGKAQVGDMVQVDMPDAQVLKVSAIAYVIPLIALILGLFAGSLLFPAQELYVLAAGLLFLGLAVVGVKMVDTKVGMKAQWQPKLIEVVAPAPEKQTQIRE